MDIQQRLMWVDRLEGAKEAVKAAEAYTEQRQADLYRIVTEATAAGMPQTEIAGALGISRQRVNQIVLAGQEKKEEEEPT